MKQLDIAWRESVAWLGEVWEGDTRSLGADLRSAEVIAVDPGNPSGVALFAPGSVTLYQVPAAKLAEAVLKAVCAGSQLNVVCEKPLHGGVIVHDPWPWKVRGFMELCAKDTGGLFVEAAVSWLKPGADFATIRTPGWTASSPGTKDALAALRYGTIAAATDIQVSGLLRRAA